MTQADLLEMAKKGHAQAIAQLINQSLQPKGITATASVENRCLQVILEAELLPKQKVLANFIYQGALSLKADSIESLIVFGKKFSNSAPSWSQSFDLVTPSALSANAENTTSGFDPHNNKLNFKPRNTSYKSKPVPRKSKLRTPSTETIAEPVSPEEKCEQRIREIGRFPTKGNLSMSYYYAIPKLAKAALSIIQSSDEIIDAIAVQYRGELAALLLTDKYLACFLFPDFSQDAKKLFVFMFDRIKKITSGSNGLIIHPKKYPEIKLYFQRKSFGKDFFQDKLPKFIFIEKRRWISPGKYEVSLSVLGVFVFIVALGLNLLTIYAIIQHIMSNLIGSGN